MGRPWYVPSSLLGFAISVRDEGGVSWYSWRLLTFSWAYNCGWAMNLRIATCPLLDIHNWWASTKARGLSVTVLLVTVVELAATWSLFWDLSGYTTRNVVWAGGRWFMDCTLRSRCLCIFGLITLYEPPTCAEIELLSVLFCFVVGITGGSKSSWEANLSFGLTCEINTREGNHCHWSSLCRIKGESSRTYPFL